MYFYIFQRRVKTIKTYGGTFGEEPGLLKVELKNATNPDNLTDQEVNDAVKRESDAVQAILFISRANQKQYAKLRNALKGEYARGYDNYPKNLS